MVIDPVLPSGLTRPAGRKDAGRSTSQSRIRVHEYRPAAPAAGPSLLRRSGRSMHSLSCASRLKGERGRSCAAPRRAAPQGARRHLTRVVSIDLAWRLP